MIRVLEYDLLDSTNLEARRLWEGGEWQSAPFAVVATEQSSGMGRDGRAWQSPAGGLWMTLAWPLPRLELAARGLALAVGLAVRDALATTTGVQAAIKWPNDLLIRGRKVCGILCQADSALAPPVVFLGIGVNANLRADELGPDLRTPATTLRDEVGRPVPVELIRDAILTQLAGRLTDFEWGGLAPLAAEIASHLAWQGKNVIVRNPGTHEELRGKLTGIDSEGRLVIDARGQIIALVSGEVRLAEG
jgi:BirA family biotin operon repressor/biotin-[acetyl-CoA-carboxylase] ligase